MFSKIRCALDAVSHEGIALRPHGWAFDALLVGLHCWCYVAGKDQSLCYIHTGIDTRIMDKGS